MFTEQNKLEMICDDIDNAISENYGNNRLNVDGIVKALSKKFDMEDVRSVMAIDVRNKGNYDGRISRRILSWANAQPISSNVQKLMGRQNIFLRSHTGLINLVAQRIATDAKLK